METHRRNHIADPVLLAIFEGMTDLQRPAALQLCAQAALADGNASSFERAALHNVATRLKLPELELSTIDADPRARSQAVAEVAEVLRGDETAVLAYEMAVAICAADGSLNTAEQWFLEALHGGLGLSRKQAEEIRQRAESLTSALAVEEAPPVLSVAAPASSPAVPMANVSAVELDRMILSHSILAGALELLPDTLATMAIVPVQMRLVYQVGKAHGYELDRGHIKDLLATVGVGLASQVVESYAERAVRGLLGRFVGGIGRSLLGQATSSGVSFATTYALGQLARQYYAGGRRFSAVELRSLYDSLISQGRLLQANHLSQIRDQAGQLNLGSLTSLLRGKG